tara:strand:- start:734 stop:1144 length:411 start_codon:yes stop_codon:yes gene_type:complete
MKKEKTMHELAKEFPNKTYRELEKYREEDRKQEAGTCIMGEMRKDREDINWEEKYHAEHKRRQEAEGETSIVKGIGQKSPEMKQLEMRLAESLQINEAHHILNGKLQERLTEVEEENKRMHAKLDEKLDSMRKSGM